MTREALGEFEQLVLLAILHLGDDVYGVPIVDEIERRTGRKVAAAAVYVTLRRLEQKGLLSSWMSDPTAARGGKARRCVAGHARRAQRCCVSRARCSTRCGSGLDPSVKGNK